MKTYRRHNCSRTHRSAKTFMACAIPHHAWIRGDGPYAVISWCHNQPTISLWDSLAEADRSKAFIDNTRCGGKCSYRHELVMVSP